MSDGVYERFVERFLVGLLRGGDVSLDLPTSDAFWRGISGAPASDVSRGLQPAVDDLHRQARRWWARWPRELDLTVLLQDAALLHDILAPMHPGSGNAVSRRHRIAARMDEHVQIGPRRTVLRHVLATAGLQLQRHDHEIRWAFLGGATGYGRDVSWRKFWWRSLVREERPIVRASSSVDDGPERTLFARLSPLTALSRGWLSNVDLAAASRLLTHRPLARCVVQICHDSDGLADAIAERLDSASGSRAPFWGTDIAEREPPTSDIALQRWRGLLAYLAVDASGPKRRAASG